MFNLRSVNLYLKGALLYWSVVSNIYLKCSKATIADKNKIKSNTLLKKASLLPSLKVKVVETSSLKIIRVLKRRWISLITALSSVIMLMLIINIKDAY